MRSHFFFRISSVLFSVFLCCFWYVSVWTLTTPCFLAVGWGTMIYFSSIMCVLNAWRLAPLKQNQTIGNERQLAFSCILNIKTKSGNWAIKMSRQPLLAQAPKHLFPACLKQWHVHNTNPTNQTIADGALDVQILGAWALRAKNQKAGTIYFVFFRGRFCSVWQKFL